MFETGNHAEHRAGGQGVSAIRWQPDALVLLDQRLLPHEEHYLTLRDAGAVAEAIRAMVVRGAPAIGISAAYGVVLAAQAAWKAHGPHWREAFAADVDRLSAARPTAVNLHWALARMRRCADALGEGDPVPALRAEAEAIHGEDVAANRRMGELGAALIESPCAVLTHCNTGSLATGGYGTALGVIRSAHAAGRITQVYAGETRPWLQGARLTAWELVRENIPVALIADSASAALLAQGVVRWVIVGADRIAANGDVANKIGTCSAAIVARYYGARFMVVVPTSTIDSAVPDGAAIPIEQRAADELLSLNGTRIAAAGAEAWNPVFDITPAGLVDALVTERGVVLAPDAAKIAALLA
jgi:methylthioribose-1-phosphate isomerase